MKQSDTNLTGNTKHSAEPSTQHPAIEQTQKWLEKVVIGLNFCPFAKKEFVNDTINYHVSTAGQIEPALHIVLEQCQRLKDDDSIETSLIVFNLGFRQFEKYLDLVDYANELIEQQGFAGFVQIASFHPEYLFDGDAPDAASNYTNRSPYPMIHLIREASMERVLAVYPEPELIPDNNIALAEQKGAKYFQGILKSIRKG